MKRNSKAKAYRNVGKLVKIYRLIEGYIEKEGGDSPSLNELVKMGVASSTSVVSFYRDWMVKLGMIRYTPRRDRSIRLLPLDQASPEVQEYIARNP